MPRSRPERQLLCVSYAQDLADKFSPDCRPIVARLATSVGGVLTAHGL
jgi:hypothetical protein